MKVKKETTMSWEEAPDVITPHDLTLITGLGLQACIKIFEACPNTISKKIIGNQNRCDKEVMRLYLQGINLSGHNNSNILLIQILQELKFANAQTSKNVTDEDEDEELEN